MYKGQTITKLADNGRYFFRAFHVMVSEVGNGNQWPKWPKMEARQKMAKKVEKGYRAFCFNYKLLTTFHFVLLVVFRFAPNKISLCSWTKSHIWIQSMIKFSILRPLKVIWLWMIVAAYIPFFPNISDGILPLNWNKQRTTPSSPYCETFELTGLYHCTNWLVYTKW